MEIRTRMAPSPTGEYHIGHIRTLLYNYAYAKKNMGKFILRIEDTDRERYVEGAVDRILDIINDYGFSWDEGPRVGGPHTPYVQSERLDSYKKYAEDLVRKGLAYYCFCSSERLENLREEQRKKGLTSTKYDRYCLSLSPEEIEKNIKENKKYVIRLKVPENKDIIFIDAVLGEVKINTNDIDDQVLLKSDGFPTYHLAVVIDDHEMEITHVMRGIDWLPSTPKHVLLYDAFGWNIPVYVHLPNLKELGGNKKLSKRYGSVAAIDFLKEGYLTEALVNFIMFLGWNPGGEKEIYSLDDFINEFSLERIHKTDLVAFDRQKLLWMNGYYIRNLDDSEIYNRLRKWAEKFNISLNIADRSDDYNIKVISLVKDRMKLLSDFSNLTGYFYKWDIVPKERVSEYTRDEIRALEILVSFHERYLDIKEGEWVKDRIDEINHEIIKDKGYSPKEAFMTIRIALTSSSATPSLVDITELLGKKEVLLRLEREIKSISI